MNLAPRALSWMIRSPALTGMARVALTCPFWISGLAKLMDWNAALAEMQHFGLEPALPLAILVVLLQLGGSIAIIANRWVWLAAISLGLFTAVATLIAHAFWTFSPSEQFAQRNIFFEHLSIIAGLWLAAVLSEERRNG